MLNDGWRDKGRDGEGGVNNREFVCRAKDEIDKEVRYENG